MIDAVMTFLDQHVAIVAAGAMVVCLLGLGWGIALLTKRP